MKRKVLILTSFYTPGVKGGGPIQSIKNLVDNLSNEFEFFILTSDRDLGDKHPFRSVESDKWTQTENAKVYYISPDKLNLSKMIQIIKSVDCDTLYLNSFFNFKYSIAAVLLNKLNKIRANRIIIAPRGEFSKGALGLKSKKKKLYINTAKILGLYKNTSWHATAEPEKEDIKKVFGETVNIKVANNLTPNYKKLEYTKDIYKDKGSLKIIFISRIHPKKNLKLAIDLLTNINGNIKLSIYGPIEDQTYWSNCEKSIDNLPSNIEVLYNGLIDHKNVMKVFKENHVFLFPTLGENFGHVISEALIGGCPVIISDQTPWKGLSKYNVGWDISLTKLEDYKRVLQYYVDLDNEEYQLISKNAFEFGKKSSTQNQDIKNHFNLLI